MENDQIPPEIHDLIFDYLRLPPTGPYASRSPKQAEMLETLLSYSLVSRTYRMRACTELFSSFVLDIKLVRPSIGVETPAAVMRQCSILLSNSLRFPYVGMVYAIHSFALWLDGLRGETRMYDILLEGDLPLLLDTLHGPKHGIQFLGFDAGNNFEGGLEYTKMDLSVICALDRMYHSPNLQHLLFRGVRNIPRTLLNGTNINALEIYGESTTNIGFIQNSLRAISLDLMGIGTSFNVADLIRPDVEPQPILQAAQDSAFSGLRKIYVALRSVAALPKVMNTVVNIAGSLQFLHIHLVRRSARSVVPLNSKFPFHLLPNLISLHISNGEKPLFMDQAVVLPFLAILESCTLPLSLNQLHLEISTVGEYAGINSTSFDTYPDCNTWLRMDALFMQPTFIAIPLIQITLYHDVFFASPFLYMVQLDTTNYRDLLYNHLLDVLPEFSKSRQTASPSGSCVNVILLNPPAVYQELAPRRLSEVVPRCGPKLKREAQTFNTVTAHYASWRRDVTD